MKMSKSVRTIVGVGLLLLAGGLAPAQAPSPRDVLEHFCELDAAGEQITPGGWEKIAALFVKPGTPRQSEVTVVRDFVVSRPLIEKGRAEFYVEYIELGRIDVATIRFSNPLPNGIKVRAGFYVVQQSKPGSGGAPVWRIEGPVPEPHLTVETAIRYVTELRDRTKDPRLKRNANRTLTSLRYNR